MIKRIDSISSVHLKINLLLNFVMIALSVCLILFVPYLAIGEGKLYLLEFKEGGGQGRAEFWYSNYNRFNDE